MKHMSVLVTDFCAFSQRVREGIEVTEELREEIFLVSKRSGGRITTN